MGDLIKDTQKKTNSANMIRNGRKVRRLERESKIESCKRSAFISETWKPVVKKLRRKFRDKFRGKKWAGIWIEWRYSGYSYDPTTHYVSAYFHYTIRWRGLKIERQFFPKCVEDIDAEAWKIAGVLLEWAE